MYWILLILAIACEVIGTLYMKLSNGFTKPVPSVLLFVFYVLSTIFLVYALKKIDIGIAYAIWSGIGTAAIAIISVWYFGEPTSWIKIVSVILIILGVIGLNLSGH